MILDDDSSGLPADIGGYATGTNKKDPADYGHHQEKLRGVSRAENEGHTHTQGRGRLVIFIDPDELD